VRRALETGKDAPSELSEFAIAEQFWQSFGVRVVPETLDDWPEQQIGAYIQILDARAELQSAKADGSATTPAKSEATEKAFGMIPRRERGT
jgi:hypothetical protein